MKQTSDYNFHHLHSEVAGSCQKEAEEKRWKRYKHIEYAKLVLRSVAGLALGMLVAYILGI